jgi:hypothetical protein
MESATNLKLADAAPDGSLLVRLLRSGCRRSLGRWNLRELALAGDLASLLRRL